MYIHYPGTKDNDEDEQNKLDIYFYCYRKQGQLLVRKVRDDKEIEDKTVNCEIKQIKPTILQEFKELLNGMF